MSYFKDIQKNVWARRNLENWFLKIENLDSHLKITVTHSHTLIAVRHQPFRRTTIIPSTWTVWILFILCCELFFWFWLTVRHCEPIFLVFRQFSFAQSCISWPITLRFTHSTERSVRMPRSDNLWRRDIQSQNIPLYDLDSLLVSIRVSESALSLIVSPLPLDKKWIKVHCLTQLKIISILLKNPPKPGWRWVMTLSVKTHQWGPESPWKAHKSKDHDVLHQNYTELFSTL